MSRLRTNSSPRLITSQSFGSDPMRSIELSRLLLLPVEEVEFEFEFESLINRCFNEYICFVMSIFQLPLRALVALSRAGSLANMMRS